jgi:dCTP deaminase
MTVLSDGDIEEAIQRNDLSIEPFIPKNLTPNGYDLSIEEVFIRTIGQHIKEGIAVVPPLTWFAISTKEFVKMGPQITSQLWIRSSYARKGILASFGKVDAGFHGTLTFGCFNASDKEVEIPIGDRFCQIVFESLATIPKALYHERSGTYQNQRGVTLQP